MSTNTGRPKRYKGLYVDWDAGTFREIEFTYDNDREFFVYEFPRHTARGRHLVFPLESVSFIIACINEYKELKGKVKDAQEVLGAFMERVQERNQYVVSADVVKFNAKRDAVNKKFKEK